MILIIGFIILVNLVLEEYIILLVPYFFGLLIRRLLVQVVEGDLTGTLEGVLTIFSDSLVGWGGNFGKYIELIVDGRSEIGRAFDIGIGVIIGVHGPLIATETLP